MRMIIGFEIKIKRREGGGKINQSVEQKKKLRKDKIKEQGRKV